MNQLREIIEDGGNPFTFLLNNVPNGYYKQQNQDVASEFRIKLVILFSLQGLTCVAGLFYLIIQVVEAKYKGVSPFWVFKRVGNTHNNNRYIISNTRLLFPIIHLVELVLLFIFTYGLWVVYVECGSQVNYPVRLAFVPCVVISAAWILEWGLFQSATVMDMDLDNRNDHLSPTIANSIFALGGLFVSCSTGGLGIAAAIYGRKFIDISTDLRATLSEQEKLWMGVLNPIVMLQISTKLNHMKKASKIYFQLTGTSQLLSGLIGIFLAIGGLYSFRVVKILQRSIVAQRNLLQRAVIQERRDAQDRHSFRSLSAFTSALTNFDRKTLRAMLNEYSYNIPIVDLVNALLAMERAKADLFLVLTATTVIVALCAGYATFVGIASLTQIIVTFPWPVYEFCATGLLWLYSLSSLVFFSVLSLNAIHDIPRSTRPDKVDILVITINASQTVMEELDVQKRAPAHSIPLIHLERFKHATNFSQDSNKTACTTDSSITPCLFQNNREE